MKMFDNRIDKILGRNMQPNNINLGLNQPPNRFGDVNTKQILQKICKALDNTKVKQATGKISVLLDNGKTMVVDLNYKELR